MVSFGYGVGDFLAVGTLVAKTVKSLSDSRDASDDCKSLVRSLESLQTSITTARGTLDTTYGRRATVNAIQVELDICEKLIRNFSADSKAYTEQLCSDGEGRNKVIRELRKISWTMFKTDDIQRLQRDLQAHLQALDLLVGALTCEMIQSSVQGQSKPRPMRPKMKESADSGYSTSGASDNSIYPSSEDEWSDDSRAPRRAARTRRGSRMPHKFSHRQTSRPSRYPDHAPDQQYSKSLQNQHLREQLATFHMQRQREQHEWAAKDKELAELRAEFEAQNTEAQIRKAADEAFNLRRADMIRAQEQARADKKRARMEAEIMEVERYKAELAAKERLRKERLREEMRQEFARGQHHSCSHDEASLPDPLPSQETETETEVEAEAEAGTETETEPRAQEAVEGTSAI